MVWCPVRTFFLSVSLKSFSDWHWHWRFFVGKESRSEKLWNLRKRVLSSLFHYNLPFLVISWVVAIFSSWWLVISCQRKRWLEEALSWWEERFALLITWESSMRFWLFLSIQKDIVWLYQFLITFQSLNANFLFPWAYGSLGNWESCVFQTYNLYSESLLF